MQKQLSELVQQIVHVILACNEEKDVLEEEFDSVKNGIIIMEGRLQTEKFRIDSRVQGVGSKRQFQQAMLEEICSGIHVLQEQDNQIVGEATDLFVGIRQELQAQHKNVIDHGLQIFAVKTLVHAVQKTLQILSKRIDEVNKVLATIMGSMKNVPSERELRQHQVIMDEKLGQVEQINTGLTNVIDQYKFSKSTPVTFRQGATGPAGT